MAINLYRIEESGNVNLVGGYYTRAAIDEFLGDSIGKEGRYLVVDPRPGRDPAVTVLDVRWVNEARAEVVCRSGSTTPGHLHYGDGSGIPGTGTGRRTVEDWCEWIEDQQRNERRWLKHNGPIHFIVSAGLSGIAVIRFGMTPPRIEVKEVSNA